MCRLGSGGGEGGRSGFGAVGSSTLVVDGLLPVAEDLQGGIALNLVLFSETTLDSGIDLWMADGWCLAVRGSRAWRNAGWDMAQRARRTGPVSERHGFGECTWPRVMGTPASMLPLSIVAACDIQISIKGGLSLSAHNQHDESLSPDPPCQLPPCPLESIHLSPSKRHCHGRTGKLFGARRGDKRGGVGRPLTFSYSGASCLQCPHHGA